MRVIMAEQKREVNTGEPCPTSGYYSCAKCGKNGLISLGINTSQNEIMPPCERHGGTTWTLDISTN